MVSLGLGFGLGLGLDPAQTQVCFWGLMICQYTTRVYVQNSKIRIPLDALLLIPSERCQNNWRQPIAFRSNPPKLSAHSHSAPSPQPSSSSSASTHPPNQSNTPHSTHSTYSADCRPSRTTRQNQALLPSSSPASSSLSAARRWSCTGRNTRRQRCVMPFK